MQEVTVSRNALESVAAVLSSQGGPTKSSEAERAYNDLLARCVWKPEGHAQVPAREGSDCPRLYTVTTIAPSARYGGTRTPGIFTSFERAREVVEGNLGDIWEHSYMLAVIEALHPDRLYSMLDEVYWYRWDGSEKRYRAIETPSEYAQTALQPIG